MQALYALIAVAALFLASANLRSQAPLASSQSTTRLPAFEVASVKPSRPGPGEVNGFYTYPGGKVVGHGCTLQFLLMEAFNVRAFQVIGGPEWISYANGDRFEVEALPPDSSLSRKSNPALAKNPPNEEQRRMLQSLLIDRFQLKFHRATTEGPVYLLARGDKPLKLTSPKDPDAFSWAGAPQGGAVSYGTGLAGTNISMPQLAVRLSTFVGRTVLDQTGLQGSFDFEYKTGDDDREADSTATVITSLKELGLKLTPAKAPVESIVIDSAEKPSAN